MNSVDVVTKETSLERGERLCTEALNHAMKFVQHLRPDIDDADVDALADHLYGLADAIAEYPQSASAMASTMQAAMRATAWGNMPGTCCCELSKSGSVTFVCQTTEL